jgi:hypothetical protein
MEILLISLGLALLFVVLGIPLLLGKVKRNSLYGARFPATMSDDRVWDVVNRKMGFVFVAGGAAAVIVDLLAVAGIVTQGCTLWELLRCMSSLWVSGCGATQRGSRGTTVLLPVT